MYAAAATGRSATGTAIDRSAPFAKRKILRICSQQPPTDNKRSLSQAVPAVRVYLTPLVQSRYSGASFRAHQGLQRAHLLLYDPSTLLVRHAICRAVSQIPPPYALSVCHHRYIIIIGLLRRRPGELLTSAGMHGARARTTAAFLRQ